MDIEAPRVSAVIVTWNKKKDVLGLLESLQEINYPRERLDITVVDNNSTDDTVKSVKSLFPNVNVLENRENLGGAGGFNTGMKWVLENRPDAEFLWLLDNDVLVDKDALKELVLAMKAEPRAGICGSRIMNIHHPNELIEVGAFINYDTGDVRCNIPTSKDWDNPKAVFRVDYVAACSLLARVSAVKKLGIWYEPFFIYWDDMEWGARFNRDSSLVLAVNGSLVYHPSWAGRAVDISAVWRNYYRARNSLLFLNNYTDGLKRRRILFKMILRYAGYSANTATKVQPAISRAFMDGIKDFFNNKLGKKEFKLPDKDRDAFFSDHNVKSVCLFLSDAGGSRTAKKYMKKLKKATRTLRSPPSYQKGKNCGGRRLRDSTTWYPMREDPGGRYPSGRNSR